MIYLRRVNVESTSSRHGHVCKPHKCTELAHILWGSPLLQLPFSLMAVLFLCWLWRNRCCGTGNASGDARLRHQSLLSRSRMRLAWRSKVPGGLSW
jgi:hypothetical protein